MTIAALLASGAQVQITLLRELPESSDPSTWATIPFTDGGQFFAVPQIAFSGDVLIGSIALLIVPQLAAPAIVTAFGVRFQSQTLFVGSCSAFYLAAGFPIIFRVTFFLYPWAE